MRSSSRHHSAPRGSLRRFDRLQRDRRCKPPRALVLTLGCLVGFGCEVSPAKPDTEAITAHYEPATNLILISIDTLRADRIGAYGYPRPTSPALDSLAARGIRFDHVIAESNWTLPSHMTLFTGLHPRSHGVLHRSHKLSGEIPTLPEVLRDNGFRNFGVTSGANLRGGHGFRRGFELYQQQIEGFGPTLAIARKRIRHLAADDRYFLFLHTFDVHCPYVPSEKYAKMFQTRPAEDAILESVKCRGDWLEKPYNPGQLRHLSDRYDAGIREADDHLGEFFEFLEERSSFDDTIVIVVSDHGEEFKEHGAIGHGKNLHNVSLRVPLIVAAPGLRPGVVRAGAGLVDIMPTVLEMLGVEGPPVQGQSLLAEMLVPNPEPAPRPLFSESERRGRWNSVFYGDHHLILQRRNKTYRLYDWVADPSEQSPLEFHSSQVGQTLAEYLRAHMANTARGAPGSAPAPSPEEIEMLKKMGYIEE